MRSSTIFQSLMLMNEVPSAEKSLAILKKQQTTKCDRWKRSLQSERQVKLFGFELKIQTLNASMGKNLPSYAHSLHRNRNEKAMLCMCLTVSDVIIICKVERTKRMVNRNAENEWRQNSSKCYWTSRKIVKPIHDHSQTHFDMLTYWTMQRSKRHTRPYNVACGSECISSVCVRVFFGEKQFFVGKGASFSTMQWPSRCGIEYIVISISLWLSTFACIISLFIKILEWNFNAISELKIEFEF